MKAGWREARVGEVCTVIAGQSPESSAYNDQAAGLPFYQGKKEFGERRLGSPTTWTTVVTKEALAGDILMSVRAPVGPINEATERICIGRGLAAIRAKTGLCRDFLWYALLWLQPSIKGSAGAVFESINKAGIESLPIPLPPLEEQHQIVAVLDEAFEGLSRARAHAEANLRDSRELFSQEVERLFTNGREGWINRSIGELCTIRSGTTVPAAWEKPEGDLPYAKVADMNLNENVDGMVTSSRFLQRSQVSPGQIIPAGATVFPKRGGAILTNKKRKVLVDLCVDLNIMSVIPGPDVYSEYLHFYFLSLDMRKIGSGSAVPQINNYDILPLQLSFPADLEEQSNVADMLQVLNEQTIALEKAYRLKLECIDALRQSLLQKAFAGELT